MTKNKPVALVLSASEAEALRNLLVEEAMRLDDDGNEGTFEQTLLAAIYHRLDGEMA
jgi:hypothetical protein